MHVFYVVFVSYSARLPHIYVEFNAPIHYIIHLCIIMLFALLSKWIFIVLWPTIFYHTPNPRIRTHRDKYTLNHPHVGIINFVGQNRNEKKEKWSPKNNAREEKKKRNSQSRVSEPHEKKSHKNIAPMKRLLALC